MALQLEGKEPSDIEQQVDRLENTLKAIAWESQSLTIRGPCRACERCLVFEKHGRMYCPHCGDGQSV